MAETTGFGSTPTLISQEEYDNLTGHYKYFRGLDDPTRSLSKQFRTGEYFVGEGEIASGTYAASVPSYAERYTNNSGAPLIPVAIPTDANIGYMFGNEGIAKKSLDRAEEYYIKAQTVSGSESDLYSSLARAYRDPSFYAITEGYDAISMADPSVAPSPELPNIIILNRSIIKTPRTEE